MPTYVSFQQTRAMLLMACYLDLRDGPGYSHLLDQHERGEEWESRPYSLKRISLAFRKISILQLIERGLMSTMDEEQRVETARRYTLTLEGIEIVEKILREQKWGMPERQRVPNFPPSAHGKRQTDASASYSDEYRLSRFRYDEVLRDFDLTHLDQALGLER